MLEYLVFFIFKNVTKSFCSFTRNNRSRDANILYDKGYFTFTRKYLHDDVTEYDLKGDYIRLVNVFVQEDVRDPIEDQKTFEIYKEIFGGEITKDKKLITPKNQSYNQVRNRIGFIFGLVSWQISNKNIEKEIPWLEG